MPCATYPMPCPMQKLCRVFEPNSCLFPHACNFFNSPNFVDSQFSIALQPLQVGRVAETGNQRIHCLIYSGRQIFWSPFFFRRTSTIFVLRMWLYEKWKGREAPKAGWVRWWATRSRVAHVAPRKQLCKERGWEVMKGWGLRHVVEVDPTAFCFFMSKLLNQSMKGPTRLCHTMSL